MFSDLVYSDDKVEREATLGTDALSFMNELLRYFLVRIR